MVNEIKIRLFYKSFDVCTLKLIVNFSLLYRSIYLGFGAEKKNTTRKPSASKLSAARILIPFSKTNQMLNAILSDLNAVTFDFIMFFFIVYNDEWTQVKSHAYINDQNDKKQKNEMRTEEKSERMKEWKNKNV